MLGQSVLSPHHWLDRSITSSGELLFKLIFITEPNWGRLTQPLPRTEPGVVISVKFKSNSRHRNWFLNFNNNFNRLQQRIFYFHGALYVCRVEHFQVIMVMWWQRCFIKMNFSLCFLTHWYKERFLLCSLVMFSLSGIQLGGGWQSVDWGQAEAGTARQWPLRLGGAGSGHPVATDITWSQCGDVTQENQTHNNSE